MKSFFVVLTFAALSFTAFSQTPSNEHADDRDALRALAHRYEEAINQGDLTVLSNSVAPNASAVFMTSDEFIGIQSMQAFLDEVKKMMGKGSRYTIKLAPDTTDFFGDFALAKGTCDEIATLGSGQTFSYKTHWTAVLRKENGEWKATRLHVSLNPFENPFITAKISVRTWITGGIAGILGLVIGFLLGMRKSAKQPLAMSS